MINVDNPKYYDFIKPENNERTRERLVLLSQCGMVEIGVGQFGVNGVMSGLYIEMIWTFSDDEFKEYMEWALSLIVKSKVMGI